MLRCRRGVVATELAILAIPLFILLLGVLEVGYDLFVQSALDVAVNTVARSVQIGNTKGSGTETSAQLIAGVCPNLSTFLNCSNLVVSVVHVTQDYYHTPLTVSYNQAASTNGGAICTGQGGQLEALVAWYNGPTFLGTLVPGFAVHNPSGGGLVHQTYSAAAFVDEYFTGGPSC